MVQIVRRVRRALRETLLTASLERKKGCKAGSPSQPNWRYYDWSTCCRPGKRVCKYDKSYVSLYTHEPGNFCFNSTAANLFIGEFGNITKIRPDRMVRGPAPVAVLSRHRIVCPDKSHYPFGLPKAYPILFRRERANSLVYSKRHCRRF